MTHIRRSRGSLFVNRFGRAEGRDFWQSPLILPILLVQAVMAGAAGFGLLGWALNAGASLSNHFTLVLLSAIVLHVLLILIEVFGSIAIAMLQRWRVI